MKIKKLLKEEAEDILQEAGPIVNLKKYGFVRAPEEDFSDDGNRFTCYWYDPDGTGDQSILASYLRADGDVYLSVHANNPETGRTEYFNDLNGVSPETAVTGLADLVKKIDAYKEKMKTYKAFVLTDEQRQQVIDTAQDIIKAYKRIGQKAREYDVLDKALQELNFNAEDMKEADLRALRTDINALIRNSKETNEEAVKLIAKDFFKDVLKRVQGTPGGYGYDRKWHQGTAPRSLDDAIKYASGIAKVGSDYVSFRELSDKDQERIIRWVRKRIEPLLDDTFDESMTEGVDMSYINKNMKYNKNNTHVDVPPTYGAAQQDEETYEERVGEVMADLDKKLDKPAKPKEEKTLVKNMYSDKVELKESLFEDIEDDEPDDMWNKVYNELVGDIDFTDSKRELKMRMKKRYNQDDVFTANDADIGVGIDDESAAAWAVTVANHYGCDYEIIKTSRIKEYGSKHPFAVIIYTSDFMYDDDEEEVQDESLLGTLMQTSVIPMPKLFNNIIGNSEQ